MESSGNNGQELGMTQPTPITSSPRLDAETLANRLDQMDRHDARVRRFIGGVFVAAGVISAGVLASGHLDHARFSRIMPFEQELQTGVDNTDNVLEIIGEIALPTALTVIGGVKLLSNKDTRLKSMDVWSSKEASTDTDHKDHLVRRGLESTFAGKVPILAAFGAGLAVFSTAIGTEVSTGPQRPIDKVFDTLVPGQTMVVQYQQAQTMVESHITPQLAADVVKEAASKGVAGHILTSDLGVISKDNGKWYETDLAFGINVPSTSPISWKSTEGCKQIPVAVDSHAGVKVNSLLEVDGNSARVTELLQGLSATNRVGVIMDKEAYATCVDSNVDSDVYGVVLDAPLPQAEQILEAANSLHQTSVVISKEQFKKNSEAFWKANVLPITSVLSVISAVFAFASMGGAMRARLLRNRRELAARSAAGNSDGLLRATELLRATKDGVIASTVGVIASVVATPLIANPLVSGFDVSVGLKEAMVGFSVGLLGTIGGAAKSLMRPQKIIDTAENTRV